MVARLSRLVLCCLCCLIAGSSVSWAQESHLDNPGEVPKYIKDPKVSVEIAAHRPFFILGEVRTAGQYPFVSGMTVQTAVAIAGGYSERATERKVIITRRINGVIEKLKVSSDMPVLPGDTIHIPERFF